MFVAVGISSLVSIFVCLLITCGVFLIRSENISYNPCSYNVFKDDYQKFIITGVLHSFVIAVWTILQLLCQYFTNFVAIHLNGSLQMLSLVPTLAYCHLNVMNYQYRYTDIQNRAYLLSQKTFYVEMYSFFSFIILTIYACLLFLAETSFPFGIYSSLNMDPHTGWTMENYEVFGYVSSGIATALMLIDFARIARLCFRIRKLEIVTEDIIQYQFRTCISKNIEPYFIVDLLILYLPTQYLFFNSFSSFELNEQIFIAKCLIISHPMIFTFIYMIQIKLATRKTDRSELECGCYVCARKKSTPSVISQFINMRVLGSNRHDAPNGTGNNEADGSRETEQLTETTLANSDIVV